MPGEVDLPDDLSSLARRNAMELSETRWEYDVEQLVKALGQHVEVCAADVAEGGLAGAAKTFAANRVALALVALAVLAGAGLIGRRLLSPPETKGSQAAALTASATPDPSAADAKELEEINKGRDVIAELTTALDSLLAVQLTERKNEEVDALNKQLIRHTQEYNDADKKWSRLKETLSPPISKHPEVNDAFEGVLAAVEAYRKCVYDLTKENRAAANRGEKPAYENKCESQQKEAGASKDKLTEAMKVLRH